MTSFPHVEDYLEVVAGHRDPVNGRAGAWYMEFKPIINLARYDVRVLDSMTHAVTQNQALTERQAQLLCKIILTYARQLSALDIDVTPVRNPEWRIPLRKMDYSQRLTLDRDRLVVQFPFNTETVEAIKTFARDSQGSAQWDRDRKVWLVGLTEYNLSWLYAWATVNRFEIDTTVHELMAKITYAEQSGYAIELCLDSGQLTVTNAENSLVEYIHNNLGGFELDNLLTLVDNSGILGYTVSKDISQAIIDKYGPRFYNLLNNREIKINPQALFTGNDFDSILDYADTVQRWPVVVYEPDLSGRMLGKLRDKYGINYNQERYIHTIKPIHTQTVIPLLISSAGMIFGGDKQLMLQQAEKVVYCAQDVYNKKTNSKVNKL